MCTHTTPNRIKRSLATDRRGLFRLKTQPSVRVPAGARSTRPVARRSHTHMVAPGSPPAANWSQVPAGGPLPSPGQRGGNPRGSALQRGLEAPASALQCRPPAPSLPCCLSKPPRLAGPPPGQRSPVLDPVLSSRPRHAPPSCTRHLQAHMFSSSHVPSTRSDAGARAVSLPFIHPSDEAIDTLLLLCRLPSLHSDRMGWRPGAGATGVFVDSSPKWKEGSWCR